MKTKGRRIMMDKQLFNILENRPSIHSFVSQDEQQAFEKNSSDLAYLISNKKTPLKVVLMGEVKAGKSTLINAIIGEEVSPVGVTETTSVIMDISHSIEKSGVIHWKDGSKKSLTIPNIYQLLKDNIHTPTFYSEIESVKLTFPFDNLQSIQLIDTPGMETITSSNNEITKKFIQKADVVLWVLSAHHIGQINIEDQILEVADYGKPVVILINRMDQINGEVSRVVDYVNDEYGLYAKAVFPVSGYMALEGKKSGNQDLYKQSGLNEIMKYLEENIEIIAEDVKENSIQQSIKQIFKKEAHLSEMVLSNIRFSENSLHHRIEDIHYYRDKIKDQIQREAKQWLAMEFMYKEEIAVMELIKPNGKSLLSNHSKKIQELLIEYSSETYISSRLNEFWEKLTNMTRIEIETALKVINENFQREELIYQEEYQREPIYREMTSEIVSKHETTDLVDGAKKGAFVGGAYGLAAATYVAVLGPYAAYWTIGAAIGSALPPVLLVGAVTGVAFKFINRDKKVKEIQESAQKIFNEIHEQVEQSVEQAVDNLCDQQNQYFQSIENQITTTILKGNAKERVQVLRSEWEKHILSSASVNLK